MTSVAGVPLLYVIRITAALPANDPGFGLPTFDVELHDRGRHDGINWPSSNKVVWTMVRHVCHGTEAWHHVKRFESRHNGRGAFLALVQTHMGADIQYNLKHSAEMTLQTLRFDGRSRNFTFDNFTGRFKDALNELDELNMSEETKVMKFRAAFQVKEFVHLHRMIASIPTLSSSLDNTIAFVGEQLRSAKQQNTSHQSRNLSSHAKTSGKSAEKTTHKRVGEPQV